MNIKNKIVELCISQGCGENTVTPEAVVYGIAKVLAYDELTIKNILPDDQDLKELEELRSCFNEKKLNINLIRTGVPLVQSFSRDNEQKEKLKEYNSFLDSHAEEVDCKTLLELSLGMSVIPFQELCVEGKSISDIISFANSLNQQVEKTRFGETSTDTEIDTDAGKTEETLEEAIAKYAPDLLYSPNIVAFLKDMFSFIPVLINMGYLDVFRRRAILLSIESGEGLTSFLTIFLWVLTHYNLIKKFTPKNITEYYLKKRGGKEGEYFDWDRINRLYSDKDIDVNGVMCLDISEWTSDLKKDEIKAYLKAIRKTQKNVFTVFRVPCLEKYVLDEIAEDIQDIMGLSTLYVPPLRMSSMIDYIMDQMRNHSVDQKNLEFDDTIKDPLEKLIIQEKSDDSFYGFKTLTNIVDNIIWSKARKNMKTGLNDMSISNEDIEEILSDNTSGTLDPWAQLNRLIGLEAIKHQLKEIVIQIQTQRKMEDAGKSVSRPVIHMIFKGNPGTGKTEVARLIGKIFKQEGILRKGHFFEYQGRSLCGQFVGETAPKTSAICHDAYGSVLFIDEAYSLYSVETAERDFGKEALTTLVAEMENHRDDLCVIMAGYSKDMDVMLTGNQGLKSRIGYEIEFPNYTREELCEIFYLMAEGKFELDEDLADEALDFFSKLPDEFLNNKEFSNARFVRNLFEKVWGKAAYRCEMEDQDNIRLTKADFESVINENLNDVLVNKKKKNPIGFVVE